LAIRKVRVSLNTSIRSLEVKIEEVKSIYVLRGEFGSINLHSLSKKTSSLIDSGNIS
jgi:hypothetical protein